MKSLRLILCIFLLYGCRKSSEPVAQPEPQPEPQPVPNCNVPLYTGVLQVTYPGNVYAQFHTKPLNECTHSIAYQNTVSSVSVDDQILQVYHPPVCCAPSYFKSTDDTLVNETWRVNGANGIPSFTFSNPHGFPVIGHPLATIDTIYKKVGLTFTLTSTGMTEGTLKLRGYPGDPVATFTLGAGANVITISAQQLSQLKAGYYEWSIDTKHRSFPTISGHVFKSDKLWQYNKLVYLEE
jgi:hypothetical protein